MVYVPDLPRRFPYNIEVVPSKDVAQVLSPQGHLAGIAASRVVGEVCVDAVPQPQHPLGDAPAVRFQQAVNVEVARAPHRHVPGLAAKWLRCTIHENQLGTPR
jgi:hypothetical protein